MKGGDNSEISKVMSNEENGKGSEKRFVKGGQTKYENHGTFRVIGDDLSAFQRDQWRIMESGEGVE